MTYLPVARDICFVRAIEVRRVSFVAIDIRVGCELLLEIFPGLYCDDSSRGCFWTPYEIRFDVQDGASGPSHSDTIVPQESV